MHRRLDSVNNFFGRIEVLQAQGTKKRGRTLALKTLNVVLRTQKECFKMLRPGACVPIPQSVRCQDGPQCLGFKPMDDINCL